MLSQIKVAGLTLKGLSLGGVYTSIAVKELGALFDVGIAPRSFASISDIFLSHGHSDHLGALPALLGIRGLFSMPPPRVFLPEEIIDPLLESLRSMEKIQRYPLAIEPVGVKGGDVILWKGRWSIKVFPTFHPVPSVAYLFVESVQKLKPEYRSLPGGEIGRLRKQGADILHTVERPKLAYVTDTLIQVYEHSPELLEAEVLISECSFLDHRKSRQASRAGCHIHLDELIEMAEQFKNPHLVLMHISQMYSPKEARRIIAERLPSDLAARVQVLAPPDGPWPG